MISELLRRAVRECFGYTNPMYRAGAKMIAAAATIRSEGLDVYRRMKRIENGAVGAPPEHLQLRRLSHPIGVRPGTQDVHTITDTIIRREYGSVKSREPRWMVDAGGYIGDAAAYFLSRFPTLRCIVLEPHPDNFVAAKANLSLYGNRAIVLEQGLWRREETLAFGGLGTAGSLGEGGHRVMCTTIPQLMSHYGLDHIDILKVDIEGAETEVFRPESAHWLDCVGEIIIETHGDTALQVVRAALTSAGFEMSRYRSIWYCRR